MAACTHGVQTPSTADATSYAAGAFTPATNDLLVCMVVATNTVDSGTVTSTGNTAAWTKITSAVFASSAHTVYLFVQNALCTNTSTTVTFNCAGDAGTGAVVAVLRVSGLTRTGSAAVTQSAILQNQTVVTVGNAISSPTLGASALTGNPTVEFMGNDKADTFAPPTNWTEGAADGTYSTPSTGFEYHFRNSGFTGTNTGWADTTGQANVNYASILVELDTSAAGGTTQFGSSTVSITDTITTAGTRKTFSTSTVAEVVTVTTAATRKTFGVSTVAETVTVTTAGTRKTFATSTVAEVVNATTNGVRTRLGSTVVAETVTVTTAGTRTATGISTVAEVVTITSTGKLTAHGSSTVSEVVLITTNGAGGTGLAGNKTQDVAPLVVNI